MTLRTCRGQVSINLLWQQCLRFTKSPPPDRPQCLRAATQFLFQQNFQLEDLSSWQSLTRVDPKQIVRLVSKPQRQTVKPLRAQSVLARGNQLGPSGLVSALGSINSRSGPAIQTKTEHTLY